MRVAKFAAAASAVAMLGACGGGGGSGGGNAGGNPPPTPTLAVTLSAPSADVTVAEGEKQAAILKSEGIRQSEILQAEGDQQAAKLRADGFAVALDRVNEVAKGVGGKAMSLQYFDTLKELGSSPSSKFIFPMEFTNMLKPFLGMGSNDEDESKDD